MSERDSPNRVKKLQSFCKFSNYIGRILIRLWFFSMGQYFPRVKREEEVQNEGGNQNEREVQNEGEVQRKRKIFKFFSLLFVIKFVVCSGCLYCKC